MSEKRAPTGTPKGGEFASAGRAEAQCVSLDPYAHISVITTPQTLDGYCAECGDSMRVPNKGLGRASVASWKTRHQHLDLTKETP